MGMDENKITIVATAPKKDADKAALRRKSFISMVQKCNNYFSDFKKISVERWSDEDN